MRRCFAAGLLAFGCHREVAPAHVDGSPDDGCHGFMDHAIDDLARWQLETATARARAAAEHCPQSAHPYVVLGAVRWATGDVVESTALFEQALAIDPLDFGGVLALARNLAAQGRLARASTLTQRLALADAQQAEPLLTMMRIDYLRCDPPRVAWAAEAVLPLLAEDDPMLDRVRASAAWAAALRDRGPLCVVNGESADVAMHLSPSGELAFVDATVGDRSTRATFAEMLPESWISTSLAQELDLRALVQVERGDEIQDLVLLPTIRIGGLTLENVPALVDPRACDDGVELSLGYQPLNRIAAVTRDYPRRRVTLDRVAPEPSAGDLDLVMAPNGGCLAPLVRITVNDAEQPLVAYVGGLDPEDVTIVTDRNGPKATPVERIFSVELGGLTIPSPTSRLVRGEKAAGDWYRWASEATAVDVRGSINVTLLRRHRVTYAFAAGRMSIAAR